MTLANVLGWALFAFYRQHGGPDPIDSNIISTSDQITPYFALTELPRGVAGLLFAVVLGSTMSVFSAGQSGDTRARQSQIHSSKRHLLLPKTPRIQRF